MDEDDGISSDDLNELRKVSSFQALYPSIFVIKNCVAKNELMPASQEWNVDLFYVRVLEFTGGLHQTSWELLSEDLREEVKCVDQWYSYSVITVTIVIQIQEMKTILIKEMNERMKKMYRLIKKSSEIGAHITV